jgi:hypothetical protein
MDPEERLQQWPDDHGLQGSVAFNFSFFFLQTHLLVRCGMWTY